MASPVRDKDLLSIQQARALAASAREAQKVVKEFSQEQVDRIVEAMASADGDHEERLQKAILNLRKVAATAAADGGTEGIFRRVVAVYRSDEAPLCGKIVTVIRCAFAGRINANVRSALMEISMAADPGRAETTKYGAPHGIDVTRGWLPIDFGLRERPRCETS